ncbi:MAG TPA: amino-acid N-acetyltransferase [Pseudomonadales bacterium]|nr:amino-acid N-acetyltransferase [Pseudomonadales bacterium]
MDTLQYVKWFRGSTPYVNLHSDRTFVVMLGGEAIADPNFENIIHDVALLASLDVRLVIVFGARPQIDAELSANGLTPLYHNRMRITDHDSMNLIRGVVGDLRMQIEAKLSMGLPGTPMHAARITATGGNWVTARPLGIVDGVDFQYTGEVRRIDTDGINRQLDAGCIPIMGPFGYSPAGEIFNLAYEDVAASVASVLRADKFIALDEEVGLLDADGALISEMSPTELEVWMAEQDDASEAGSELLRQAGAMLWAIRSGVRRGHVVSHAEDGALLTELFTRDGSGTQITELSAERCRTATLEDVTSIIEMTAPLEQKGYLLPRSRERIELDIDNFWVLDNDGMVVACAALYPYPEFGCAEIACVVTHPEYRGSDRAERLIRHLERSARRQGLERTFLLTTRTAAWFIEQGYSPGDLADLPEERRSKWVPDRNSRVMIKDLTVALY